MNVWGFEETEIRNMFKLLDPFNSGFLRAKQLIIAFEDLGIPLTENEAHEMCPNQLSYEEFLGINIVSDRCNNYAADWEIFRIISPDDLSPMQKNLSPGKDSRNKKCPFQTCNIGTI